MIQKKVNWTNKQPIIVTQKPEKSRRTTETAVGKKMRSVLFESSFQLHLRRKLKCVYLITRTIGGGFVNSCDISLF